jgi:hypothetical protein
VTMPTTFVLNSTFVITSLKREFLRVSALPHALTSLTTATDE